MLMWILSEASVTAAPRLLCGFQQMHAGTSAARYSLVPRRQQSVIQVKEAFWQQI